MIVQMTAGLLTIKLIIIIVCFIVTLEIRKDEDSRDRHREPDSPVQKYSAAITVIAAGET